MPCSTTVDVPFQLYATPSGGVGEIEYLWDFGDATFSTEQNPLKTWTECGLFTVCCTITDLCNTSVTECIEVTVEGGGCTFGVFDQTEEDDTLVATGTVTTPSCGGGIELFPSASCGTGSGMPLIALDTLYSFTKSASTQFWYVSLAASTTYCFHYTCTDATSQVLCILLDNAVTCASSGTAFTLDNAADTQTYTTGGSPQLILMWLQVAGVDDGACITFSVTTGAC